MSDNENSMTLTDNSGHSEEWSHEDDPTPLEPDEIILFQPPLVEPINLPLDDEDGD